MSIGKKLLELTAEYQEATSRKGWGDIATPARSMDDIASDYESALKELLNS